MVNPFRKFWRWLRQQDRLDFYINEERYLRNELSKTRKEQANTLQNLRGTQSEQQRLLKENLHLRLVLRTVSEGVPRMRLKFLIEQQGLSDQIVNFPSVIAVPPEQHQHLEVAYMRPVVLDDRTTIDHGYIKFRVALMPKTGCTEMWAVPCDMLADLGPEAESVVRMKIREMLVRVWNEFLPGMEDRLAAALGAPDRVRVSQ
jgi:hypothetical protein